MQVAHYLVGEPFIKFVIRVKHKTVSLGALLALSHQSRVLVAFKQTGYFAVRQQRVHALEESRVENVRLVQDEHDFLAFGPRAPQHAPQVVVEVLARVVVVHFDLEDAETVDPGDEAR